MPLRHCSSFCVFHFCLIGYLDYIDDGVFLWLIWCETKSQVERDAFAIQYYSYDDYALKITCKRSIYLRYRREEWLLRKNGQHIGPLLFLSLPIVFWCATLICAQLTLIAHLAWSNFLHKFLRWDYLHFASKCS